MEQALAELEATACILDEVSFETLYTSTLFINTNHSLNKRIAKIQNMATNLKLGQVSETVDFSDNGVELVTTKYNSIICVHARTLETAYKATELCIQLVK